VLVGRISENDNYGKATIKVLVSDGIKKLKSISCFHHHPSRTNSIILQSTGTVPTGRKVEYQRKDRCVCSHVGILTYNKDGRQIFLLY